MRPHNRSTRNIDKEIGQKIRIARLSARLSQDDLGRLIGVTFQQVQKYETGTNRISIGRLLDISRALKVNAASFLDETAEGLAPLVDVDKAALALLHHYGSIKSKKTKKQLLELAKSLSS